MAINPDSLIPSYCKNCRHRFVCSIQTSLRDFNTSVKDFNNKNATQQQSVSASYVCRYKTIDTTIE